MFDLSNLIPNTVKVTDAYLTLSVANIYGGNIFTCYELLQGFSAATATFDDYSSSSLWTNPGGDFDPTAKSDSLFINTTGKVNFKLDPAMVQGWISSPATNYGMLIKGSSETNGTDSYITINDIGNSNAALTPQLTVYYTLN
jgi:hypothetical protein